VNAGILPVPLPPTIGLAQFIYFEADWTAKALDPFHAKWLLAKEPSAPNRTTLWRALVALNEEFVHVATPYFVRFYGMIAALLLVYFPLVALTVKHAVQLLLRREL
jgi:hypothetical protein